MCLVEEGLLQIRPGDGRNVNGEEGGCNSNEEEDEDEDNGGHFLTDSTSLSLDARISFTSNDTSKRARRKRR